ncbi:LPS export ABC transporter permease LptG [Mesosutterella sp. AGMB02718]|uniref:LPS export ABC transporter permease LptG n=1 Tax=Mesosutterella faecium TaxID=2925194 RepID=A0ABT7IL10_9BURK|nr:LPS export ABC transporter permease LptG [Mesosutterella sp. AGMB02718]MDL2058680.1 LPS export ABC transporter permease LptG [Mesosutterella sp. AGMB02718]
MRVITRHLTAQIFLATALVLLALIGLFLFFDLIAQVGKIGTRYSLAQAFLITALEIPSRLYEVMPIAVLLGAVYTLSRWASTSEFTILRVAGLSPVGFAKALAVPAVIFVTLTYLLGELIAPMADRFNKDVQVVINNKSITSESYRSGVWARDQILGKNRETLGVRYVNVKSLDSGRAKSAKGWRVFEFNSNDELVRMIEASEGSYNGKEWILKNATIFRLPTLNRNSETDAPSKILLNHESTLPLRTSLEPNILSVMVADAPESMSMADLWSYLQHLRSNKEETGRYEIAFWKKAFYPLSIFVMLALSMPFAYLSARAGGVSIKIFLGVMIGILFYALNSLFSYLGGASTLPPVLAALFPPAVVLLLAACAVWRVEHR